MENHLTQITNYLLTQSWQIAVLAVVIAAMSLALKNRSAHIRYLLWLIVLAKCLAPPLVTIPLAILPQESLVEPVPILPAELPAATIERVNTAITEPPIPISTPVVKEKAVRLTVHQWLGFGWVVGVAVFAVFGVIKALRTNLWLCRQRKPLPAKLQSGIEDLFSGFDLKTLPKIWLLEGISQPFVWGLLRGSIYLPADFVKVDNAEHRKGVLGHELSHILRFDAAVNLLQVIAQAIFWFHPFVWWVNKRIRAEREKCCDEMAIARLGAKVRDYSIAIVNILVEEQESTRPVPSLAVAGPVKNIEERIKTMLRPGKKFYKRPSLIAAIVVLLVAVLIVPTTLVPTARAQTRPSRLTRTVKTKVGRTAAIEQLASATIIKGRILDLKNEPAYLAHVVALPVTSYGTQIVLGNKEGYFELPWSPTWIDQGQAVCLVAKGHYGRNESVFFEVNDPALPVTIHLEPAVTITGKVIDPNGQPMRSTIILSLARPFRCRAPISADTTITADIDKSQEGKFTLSMLPYNQTYNLNIQAEGYQSTELTVDTRDTSKDNMDIGTITLQAQDPTKPVVAERSPNPDLMKEFYEIYRLEEGEVIKLIKPPFVLGRQEYLNTKQKVTSSAGLNAGGDFKIVFDWDGKLKLRAGFTGASRLNKVPALISGIPDYDFKLPKELDVRLPEGDWIVRNVSPIDEQLKALEEIIYAELHRSIRFEKRTAERNTIVVTGRYTFTPLSEEFPDRLCVFADERTHLHDGEVDSLAELLRRVAHGIHVPIDDRTEPTEIAKIRYIYDYVLVSPVADTSIDTEKDLPILLDNLARQTGLQFKVERQPAEIWFVTEQDNGN